MFRSTSTDTTVTDFSSEEGDVLNISDLFQGAVNNSNLDDLVRFTQVDTDGDGVFDDTAVYVNDDGAGNDFQQIAALENFTGDADTMFADGSLVIS